MIVMVLFFVLIGLILLVDYYLDPLSPLLRLSTLLLFFDCGGS